MKFKLFFYKYFLGLEPRHGYTVSIGLMFHIRLILKLKYIETFSTNILSKSESTVEYYPFYFTFFQNFLA